MPALAQNAKALRTETRAGRHCLFSPLLLAPARLGNPRISSGNSTALQEPRPLPLPPPPPRFLQEAQKTFPNTVHVIHDRLLRGDKRNAPFGSCSSQNCGSERKSGRTSRGEGGRGWEGLPRHPLPPLHTLPFSPKMWALPGPGHLLTLTREGRNSGCPLCWENLRAGRCQALLACPSTELLQNFF